MRLSISRHRRGHVLTVAASFGVLWWVLTGGSPSSWWFGAPLALLATALALGHAAVVWRVSPLAVARFVPFFLWRALAGGLDVARRALDPRLPLAPGLVTLRLRLTGDAAVVLTAVVNLSPGTLTVDLNGDRVTLHVVDRHGPIEAQFRATEAAVARLLGVPLLSAEA